MGSSGREDTNLVFPRLIPSPNDDVIVGATELTYRHFVSLCDSNWNLPNKYQFNNDTFNFIDTGSARFPEGYRNIMLRYQTFRLYKSQSRYKKDSKCVLCLGSSGDGNTCASLGLLVLRLNFGLTTIYQYNDRSIYLFSDGKVQDLLSIWDAKQVQQILNQEQTWFISNGGCSAGAVKFFKGRIFCVASGSKEQFGEWIVSQIKKPIYIGGWSLAEIEALLARNSGVDVAGKNIANGAKDIVWDIYRDFAPSICHLADKSVYKKQLYQLTNFHEYLTKTVSQTVEDTLKENPSFLVDLLRGKLPKYSQLPNWLVTVVPIEDIGLGGVSEFGDSDRHSVMISTRMRLKPRTRLIGAWLARYLKQNHQYLEFEKWVQEIQLKQYRSHFSFEYAVAFESMVQDLFSAKSLQIWQVDSAKSQEEWLNVELPEDLIQLQASERISIQRTIAEYGLKPCYIIPASRHHETLHGVLLLPGSKTATVVIITIESKWTVSKYSMELVANVLPEQHYESINVLVVYPNQCEVSISNETAQQFNTTVFTWKITIQELVKCARQKYLLEFA